MNDIMKTIMNDKKIYRLDLRKAVHVYTDTNGRYLYANFTIHKKFVDFGIEDDVVLDYVPFEHDKTNPFLILNLHQKPTLCVAIQILQNDYLFVKCAFRVMLT